ncbi:response regulator transcription factor [Chryseobacterium sp. JUb7]|uniref:response regulator transcription factor n=1 Tax=Chryseobacterium sp. JUb7 TaxID=2940599 RepID=UPI00216A100B|nr:response regulator transcription factor [Chryseobacterium sp. JUb7]MCS3529011.1 AraC-like DNA-binding protein [Chryseobacterium sp. JUb7]
MQTAPPKHLTPYIKHYIFLENQQETADIKKLRLFSDGNTGLILSDDRTMYNSQQASKMPLSFFYGQPDSYKDLHIQGSFSFIAVIFQPYFLNILSGISAKEARNSIIPAEDLVKNELDSFQEKLFNKENPQSIIGSLNEYFTKAIHQKANTGYNIIRASLLFILQKKGEVSMKELEHFTGYSERQIERKFAEHIGISPKKYCNIIRLHYFLGLMKTSDKNENLAGLSYSAGYSDQSHLIKEFKNNTGLTPKEYLKIKNKLAVNFIEI